jgi:hypothetical protein
MQGGLEGLSVVLTLSDTILGCTSREEWGIPPFDMFRINCSNYSHQIIGNNKHAQAVGEQVVQALHNLLAAHKQAC